MGITPKQMANLRPYAKGQVGNPRGAGAHDKTKKAIKRLTLSEVQSVIDLILKNDLVALQAIAKDTTAPVLRVWIAAIAVKAIQKGDPSALNAILDRSIGKVKENITLSSDPDAPLTIRHIAIQEIAADPESFDSLVKLDAKLQSLKTNP